ncbi:MAG: protein kinase [Acidobacteriota bacterium]
MALGPGSRLGPYEISRPLGKGGMGEVFRARDIRLERDVAVKALPPGFEADPERLARFQREARVLASLNHANVGSIYGFEESADGHAYLILECIEGETLASRLAGGWPLPLDESLRIAAEIAAGLGAAHDAGVIHRDLKPANVMLRPDGAVKVLDFGLAKTAERGSASGDQSRSPTISLGTQTGFILGTAAYMSPEQARGRALDKRTDIFSFGCVLYECLTGRRAFPGESVSDTLSAIVADEPDWAALPPSTPTRVRDLLRRCLQKDPRRRLHDISDARLELEEVMPTSSSSPDTTPTAALPQVTAKQPIPWGWLAAASVLGGALVAGVLWGRRPAPPAQASSPRLQAVLSLPEGVRLIGSGRPSTAISPDGRTVVFRGVQGGVGRLYRRDLDGSDAVPLAGTEGGVNPFFSTDGEWIGFFTLSELKKVPLSGGSAVRISDAPPVAQGGTWAEDGSILFSRTPNAGLVRVSANGGKAEPFSELAPGEHAHKWPQVLPGGRGTLVTIVFGKDFQDIDTARIAVLEPGTLHRRIVLEGSSYARYDSGQIVFVRGKHLFAVPFDLASLATVGSPVPLPENLVVDEDNGIGHFTAARGTLISPDGPTIHRPLAALFSVGRDGKGTAVPLPPAQYAHPRLSPDGRWIALMKIIRQTAKLALFERSRQILSTLTPEPGRFFCPVWSPDSQRLAFTFFNVGDPRLAVKRADAGGSIETITNDRARAEFPNSWSPDGKVILYTAEDRDTESIASRVPISLWTVNLEGKPDTRLWLGGDFRNLAGEFSPDGHSIAYVSDESGQKEVYLRPYPGPGSRIKVSANGGEEPAWTRGGHELLYRLRDDFYSVEIPQGAAQSPGAPTVLFSGQFDHGGREDSPREYDVSADGNEFLVSKTERPADVVRQLVVLTGWGRPAVPPKP